MKGKDMNMHSTKKIKPTVFTYIVTFVLFLSPVIMVAQTVPPDGRGGGVIAFNSDRDGNNEIYMMNADGSGQRNITNNPANAFFVSLK